MTGPIAWGRARLRRLPQTEAALRFTRSLLTDTVAERNLADERLAMIRDLLPPDPVLTARVSELEAQIVAVAEAIGVRMTPDAPMLDVSAMDVPEPTLCPDCGGSRFEVQYLDGASSLSSPYPIRIPCSRRCLDCKA